MNDTTKGWRLKALTDLWTGDTDRSGGRTIPTGLLGSMRWWFEVLARGLGGTSCDPSEDENRCPDQQGKRCIGCELFGCTGWGRKFRFEVRDGSGAGERS
jgi:CRISPR-associated protein Cmr1